MPGQIQQTVADLRGEEGLRVMFVSLLGAEMTLLGKT